MKKGLKKWLSATLALAMTASAAVYATPVTVAADVPSGYVSVDQLEDKGTQAPTPDDVVPTANQLKYQREGMAAFCHFGVNTFNNQEWGTNYRDPSEFTLTEKVDADRYVELLKDAGYGMLIITAKHHDGFCIWNSAYTRHDIAETNYPGDVLEDISKACTKYNMDMGLYLSPWDMTEPSYGYRDANGYATTKENDANGDYCEYYANQLREILSSEKYGNAGKFREIWMDGANESPYPQDFDFVGWMDIVRELEEDAMLFCTSAHVTTRWIGNESGTAAEQTWAQVINDIPSNTTDRNMFDHHARGFANGNAWTVPEADARINTGWFWHADENPKSLEQLADMYFNSVGHNATWLLNIPLNNQGTLDDDYYERVQELSTAINETFANNIAKDAAIYATSVRGNDTAFSPANVIDDNDDTYWTMDDDATSGTLYVDLGASKTFDVVSIEEAIQHGQRITAFSVEYSADGSEWKVFDSGSTVGSKRLSRKAPVRARYLKITVDTELQDGTYMSTSQYAIAREAKVPMISEIGVYKAHESFEVAKPFPEGMQVIDEREAAFSFEGSNWVQETGAQYYNETNTYSKKNTSGNVMKLNFTGTKVYLVGTVDPSHGSATVSIDGGDAFNVNTTKAERAEGQIIFESPDLSDGDHELVLTTGSLPVAIEAAYVINNGGLGMIGIENAKYTMNEDQTMTVNLVRVGGSTGEVTVKFEPNPGTAIQRHFNTELKHEITFADGETSKTATVQTLRTKQLDGDVYFTVELTSTTPNIILGFNDTARITIIDADGTGHLEELVAESENLIESSYTADSWAPFAEALADAVAVLESETPASKDVLDAYEELLAAKDALVARTGFTAEDPFALPTTVGESKAVEAELFELDAVETDKYVRIAESANASGGKEVDWFEEGNKIHLNYTAAVSGTYTVRATYRSGRGSSNPNAFVWSGDKITSGSLDVYGESAANVYHVAEFDVVVTEAGAGVLTFTADSKAGPVIDKFEFVAKELDYATYTVTVTGGENGTVEPAGETIVAENETKTFTFTPDEGYVVDDVLVDGESVGAVTSYTVANPTANVTIEVSFKVKPIDADDDSRDYPTDKLVAISSNEYAGTGVEGPDDHILDGNRGTYWHTDYSGGKTYAGDEMGRWVGVRLEEATELSAIRYLPRQGATTDSSGGGNGRVTEYRAEYRDALDGEWKTCATGELDYNDAGWQLIEFDEPVTAIEVRLVGVGTFTDTGNNLHMSASEFRVVLPSAVVPEVTPTPTPTPTPDPDPTPTPTPTPDPDPTPTPTPTPDPDPTPTPEVTPTPDVKPDPTPTPGEKPDDKPFRFDDVQDEEAYYFDSVYWAYDNGITTGITETLFAPENDVIRADMVTLLWRAAGSPTPENTVCTFEDVDPEQYYYTAMLWAIEEGITQGYNDKEFGTTDTCTRAQMVTFLWRMKDQTAPKTKECTFKDVAASDYYYNAVLWAVENGITTGLNATTFAPDDNCTRGQAVTFLNRTLVPAK